MAAPHQSFVRKLKNRVTRTRRDWQTRKFKDRADGVADALPHFVVYEPTLLCNLHCSFCYVADILNPDDWRSKELSLDELDRIFGAGGVKSFNITGGEPFVRKNLLEIFDLLKSKGMRCDYITTNGTVIKEDRAEALADLTKAGFLKHISVSIDGPPEFHDDVRGQRGAFQKAADNIQLLRRVYATRGIAAPVSINTTLTSGNLHLLERVVDEAEKLDVDLVGLNQLMFATREEVDETLAIIGETDADVISTHITDDPGLDPKEVPPVLRKAVAYAADKGITINPMRSQIGFGQRRVIRLRLDLELGLIDFQDRGACVAHDFDQFGFQGRLPRQKAEYYSGPPATRAEHADHSLGRHRCGDARHGWHAARPALRQHAVERDLSPGVRRSHRDGH